LHVDRGRQLRLFEPDLPQFNHFAWFGARRPCWAIGH